MLTLAGIGTSLFKGQSTKSVSSSKAEDSGASVQDSLNLDGWSKGSTWQKIYNKLVISTTKIFFRKQ